MELDWSEQSSHIRSLYRPWQPGDGYEEAEIEAAEARLGIRLPATLRNFYRAWGKRRDLASLVDPLLPPNELEMREDTLLFWVENQAAYFWGIRREALEETDPSVYVQFSERGEWAMEEELRRNPTHPHLSNFLDDMGYLHAFCRGGAIHGGWTKHPIPDLPAQHIAWLEENWNKARVTPRVFGLDPTIENWATLYGPTLYVRDGVAFWWSSVGCLAAHEADVVDEIAQRFQINWVERW